MLEEFPMTEADLYAIYRASIREAMERIVASNISQKTSELLKY